ncbi:MAG: Obg family GTPase CgtA, partial [Erysipelotrichaceae bacterium]|nr:Obg family GTPase CgtA [Erysipelotrichaceae bacterium]
KMDLDPAGENLRRFKEKYPELEVFETVTLINEGLRPVLYRAKDMLKELPQFPLYDTSKTDAKVLYTYEEPQPFTIYNEGNGIWRVEGEKVERLFRNTDFKDDDSIMRFSRAMSRMKLDDALREKGCGNGDRVFIQDYSFEFMDEEDEY